MIDWLKRNILTKWYTSSFNNIADAKNGYMYIDGFDKILNQFPMAFNYIKPLCQKIQGVFFSFFKNRKLFTGTPLDLPEKLYHPIIKVFKNVIKGTKSKGKIVVGD